VTQHLVVVTQNDPRTFWSWDQIQNDGVVVPFPTHPRTPRFDVVCESYDQNSDSVSAESEGDVAAELGTKCNLGKTIASVCLAWRCPHQWETHQALLIQKHQETMDILPSIGVIPLFLIVVLCVPRTIMRVEGMLRVWELRVMYQWDHHVIYCPML
jgi:hypothetical protein